MPLNNLGTLREKLKTEKINTQYVSIYVPIAQTECYLLTSFCSSRRLKYMNSWNKILIKLFVERFVTTEVDKNSHHQYI